MTVSSAVRSIEYTGNGSATAFSYPFKIYLQDHVRVKLITIATDEVVTLTDSQYSITGVGYSGTGGVVAYPLVGSPIASTHKLRIERIVPYKQEQAIGNQAGYRPETVERTLDLIVMMLQQIAEGNVTFVDGSIANSKLEIAPVATVLGRPAGVGNGVVQYLDADDIATILGIDRTLDADKPISTAVAAALDALTTAVNLALGDKLDAASYTASDVLTKIKTVDGSGSGLDADLVRGTTPSTFGLSLLDDANAEAARTTLGLAAVAASGSAADLSTGTLPDARLSSNIPKKDSANTFTGTQTFANNIGAEGGEIWLAKGSGSTLSGDVVAVEQVGDGFRLGNGTDGGLSHDIKQWKPAYHAIRHYGDGGFVPLFKFIPGQHHTNILNKLYSGDGSTWVDSALDSGENIELPPDGFLKITQRMDHSRQGQVMRAASDAPVAGASSSFFFYVDTDFDMAAPHIFGTVPYSRYENVAVLGYQPPAATTKAECIQYPWAFSMRAGQRSKIKDCAAFAMWNGIDARGIDLVSHPGGGNIHGFRDGCLNVGIQADNFYDFFHVDDLEFWVFGQNSNQQQISYNETVYSFILGATAESFTGGKITQWNRTFNTNTDSLFTKTISQLKLDGWASKLELGGSDTVIGLLEILCDTDLVRQIVQASSGNHEIGVLHLRTTNNQLAPIIKVTGGNLRMPGTIRTPGNAWVLEVTAGHADISHANYVHAAATRTLPAFKQTGASGKITALGLTSSAGGTGDLFAIEGTGSRIAYCEFGGYKLNAVTGLGNLFGPNLNVGSSF